MQLWQLFCSAERDHLYNYGRWYYEKQFCDIILNLGQCFSWRCRLKDFFSEALVADLLGGAKSFMQF